jgi:hypothetical protein
MMDRLMLQLRKKKQKKSSEQIATTSTKKKFLLSSVTAVPAALPHQNDSSSTSQPPIEQESERETRKKFFDDFDEEDDPDHPNDNNCSATEDDDDNTAPVTISYGSERSASSLTLNTIGSTGGGGTGGGGIVRQRSVRWSTIEFFNHELVLGDHPSVDAAGPPLSIGWKSVGAGRGEQLSIDAYENERPERRKGVDLIVPPEVRHRWLMESGYSRSEIKDCLLELAYIQESRRKNAPTMNTTPWQQKIRKNIAATFCRRPTIIEVRAFAE